MNERPILITISNYNGLDITYVIPQNANVEILKVYTKENELKELTIRANGDMKEFRTEINS